MGDSNYAAYISVFFLIYQCVKDEKKLSLRHSLSIMGDSNDAAYISIFLFNVLGDPKPICFTQTIKLF